MPADRGAPGATERPALSVAIVGGGVTGLATAYYLERAADDAGLDLSGVLVEGEQQLGGKIVTARDDGFLVEGGPDSFLTQKPWAMALVGDLGMKQDLIEQQIEGVFLLHGGRLHRIPRGLVGIVPTRPWALWTAPFLSLKGKLRASLEPFIPARRDGGPESLGAFLNRRLGSQVAQRLVGPFTAGIYAGDADRLGVRDLFPTLVEWEERHGSLTRGMRAARRRATGKPPARPFAALRDGMASLPNAILGSLRAFAVRRGAPVTALARIGGSERPSYRLSLKGGETLSADIVVLAVPAPAAAGLVRPFVPQAASLLDRLSLASTANVTVAYRRGAVSHPLDGSGFLVPRTESSPVTGCTWSSAKWPGRAPDDWVLLRSFVGSAGDDSLTKRDDPEVVRAVTEHLRPLLGLQGEPSRVWVHRWPDAMPQYEVGHGEWLDALDAALANCPGLLLAGASYRGIGVPDCIRQAKEAVDRIMSLSRAARNGSSSDRRRPT